MEAISKLQGFNLRMDYRGFSAALQALESGQADGMIAGMTVTDERKKAMISQILILKAGFKSLSKKETIQSSPMKT